ncbi:MAG TPA: topoisomerase [Firmicutes bacterium]|nr:topoisomerase [Bacillota bacterium]
MPYVTPEQIEQAKRVDLLTYLQTCEPHELVRLSDRVYTTRSHDSLKISNGKWCWWSRGIGGRSALDYLIKVRGMTLPKAVMRIDGQAVVMPPVPSKAPEPTEPRRLLLPEKNKSSDRVAAYLRGRGIHGTLIDYCLQTGRLYESRYRHNAVFVGFDPQGVPRYGALRGTSNSRFMGDVSGSDKRFSFSVPAREKSIKLHLFESAIDLLSCGTLELLSGKDWRRENCLSLAGIYKPKKNIGESVLPAALIQYLKDCPQITEISLNLDNDTPGRLAAETIKVLLPSSYKVLDEPPKRGKDYNDYLKMMLRGRHRPER